MISDKNKNHTELSETLLEAGKGLKGDRHESSNQISLLLYQKDNLNDDGQVDTNKVKGLCHKRFKANLSIECDACSNLKVGDELIITSNEVSGEKVILKLTKLKHCFEECELHQSGGYCYLVDRSGFAEVKTGGQVILGSSTSILRE
jgi:hypothetical protein